VQETYAMLDVTASKREALANMLETRIAVLAVDANRLKESIDIYKNALVPQARLALDANIAGFAANQIDLAELFMAQRMLLSYEQDLEQKYIEYIGALAELQTITAGEFDPYVFMSRTESFMEGGPEAPVLPPLAEDMSNPEPEEFAPAEQGFIDGLKLPDQPMGTSDAGAEEAAEQAAEQAEPSDNAVDPENGFYEPFERHDRRKE